MSSTDPSPTTGAPPPSSTPPPTRRAVRVVLIGAGGHARVVLDAFAAPSGLAGHSSAPTDIEIIGAVSEDGVGIEGLGVPMLGTTADLEELATTHGVDAACVTVGDNAARARLAARWLATGRPLTSAVHATAVVSPSATIGAGSVLFAGAVVNAATVLGDGVIVNTNASVDHDTRIGAFAHIAPGCALAGGVTVGARTLIGIGARVVPGVRIGDDVVVGAGAVVTTDVLDGITVVGVPARPLRPRNRP